MTYKIDFTVTLSTCRDIEASSEQEALDIAYYLQDNEEFYSDLIESWEDPFSGWNEPNYPKVLYEHDGPCDVGKEELVEYGWE